MPPVNIYAAVLRVKRHLLLVDKTNQSYVYLTTEPAASQLQKNRYAKRVNNKTVHFKAVNDKTDILRYDRKRENDMMDRKHHNEKETGRNQRYRRYRRYRKKKENRNDPGYRAEKVS